MIVVSNATPLIRLAKIHSINLLQELFGTLIIPPAVYREVVTQAPNHPGAAEIRQVDWIQVQALADHSKVDYLRADLDWGEAEALVLAEEISGGLGSGR